MRFMKIVLLAIAGLALTTGCVTTKKYEARLSDIDTLTAENTALSGKLQETEKSLTNEKASRETDVAKLVQEKEELIRTNELLMTANKDMNKSVAEISREKLNAIKDKDRIITELTQEKMNAIKERDRAIAEQKHSYDNLVSELTEEIKKGEIQVKQLKDKLTLTMVEKILFDSGKADIKVNGKKVLDRVAEILKNITDKQIKIEGHTDNVPIGATLAGKFPTNWELSTARATTVVRYLQEKGVSPAFLNAAGYSEYKPVESNETDEGKAKNRRIEIVLIPLDAENPPQQ
ncbi:MAG TPA: chemotaxis protein MotB [Nitrospiraceae bacterium]|nr:chemotaxis protein MotB [Nitrospiraceae bacterium]